jgi:hypothetical protein
LSGTYREKINLLHRLLAKDPVRKHYDPRGINIIHGLFLRQFKQVRLDAQIPGDEENENVTGYDITADKKHLNPEDYIIWTGFFKDEFEKEFNKPQLEKFLECLPDHFTRYPFDVDPDGKLTMSKYSKKMLFAAFCSVAGIAPDNELWGPFLVLIQRVIDNVNKDEETGRS